MQWCLRADTSDANPWGRTLSCSVGCFCPVPVFGSSPAVPGFLYKDNLDVAVLDLQPSVLPRPQIKAGGEGRLSLG